MATLEELHDLFNDSALLKKIRSALLISIKNILDGAPTVDDRKYAAKVFDNPGAEADRIIKYVLAANSGSTVAAIKGASDSSIQTNVDAAVPIMVQADAGT